VPGTPGVPDAPVAKQIAAPPQPPARDTTPRTIAFVGAGVLAALVAATAAIRAYRKDSAS
jgi:membrane-anchored mycosin MYCP